MNRPHRLLFSSWHCHIDPSSGAALATRDLLELLAGCGWECSVLCGPALDFHRRESMVQLLVDQLIPFKRNVCQQGSTSFSLFHCRSGTVPAALYLPGAQTRSPHPSPAEGGPFLALFDRMLDRLQPDVFLTYGGHWLGREMMLRARRRGLATVFALHNLAYNDPRFFEPIDAVLVPSRFSAEHYRRHLGLHCTAIPSPVDQSRIRCAPAHRRPQYVTFVNPCPSKGVFWFARIAEQLHQRRPDVPLLVVEGRAGVDWLSRSSLDLSRISTLHRMANTPDPRDFYRVSRMVLVPSLCQESYGRIAAEAQINGIPVLASRRGALPEVVGNSRLLFDIPAKYTPETLLVPTAEEVAPWVETIIRLLNDEPFHARQKQLALDAAQPWRPELISAEHDAFFRSVLPRTTRKNGT